MVVTDGFTGNVALKAVEGTAQGRRRDRAATRVKSSPPAMLGGLLLSRPARPAAATSSSQDKVGGGIMLGLRGVAVVAHGDASPPGSPTPCGSRSARWTSG